MARSFAKSKIRMDTGLFFQKRAKISLLQQHHKTGKAAYMVAFPAVLLYSGIQARDVSRQEMALLKMGE